MWELEDLLMEIVRNPNVSEIVAVKQIEFGSEVLITNGEFFKIEERASQYLAKRLEGPFL